VEAGGWFSFVTTLWCLLEVGLFESKIRIRYACVHLTYSVLYGTSPWVELYRNSPNFLKIE
jgi:hypothetical protein